MCVVGLVGVDFCGCVGNEWLVEMVGWDGGEMVFSWVFLVVWFLVCVDGDVGFILDVILVIFVNWFGVLFLVLFVVMV